jgi:hypothetical protein
LTLAHKALVPRGEAIGGIREKEGKELVEKSAALRHGFPLTSF